MYRYRAPPVPPEFIQLSYIILSRGETKDFRPSWPDKSYIIYYRRQQTNSFPTLPGIAGPRPFELGGMYSSIIKPRSQYV